jgi:drug/metabolite transporter (DMT)-like permease
MSVLLWALEPLLILAFAYWILHDRVSRRMAFCALVAAMGVALVVFEPGNTATLAGILLTVGGVAACAVYTVLSSKFLSDASTLTVVWMQQVAALAFSLVLLAGSFAFGEPRSVTAVSTTAWVSALVAGVVYYGVAFWFYVTGLKGVSAGRAGMFINLVPVFGLAVSYSFLDERLIGRQWAGAVFIVVAVIAVTSDFRT